MDVTFRVFDDAVAFRYTLPQAKDGATRVRGEETEFRFARSDRAWGGEFATSTEVRYPETIVGNLPTDRFSLPLAVRTKPAYVIVTEMDVRDWSGMFLARTGTDAVRAIPASDTVVTDRRESPWRVALISDSEKGLIESNTLLNLSAPSKIETDWIKPGITAWDPWWTGENPYLPQFRGLDARGDTRADMEYIDLAAEMGWPYMLVDWLWYDMNSPDPDTAMKPVPQIDLPALFAHAKEKNVRLILWVHHKDVRRTDCDKLFALYEKWGAAGVKIDFMERDDQEMMKWYETTLATAARHHLFVNYHGAAKPLGLSRTYPNLLTQEGVLGNEYNKLWGNKFDLKQMITLPFTRGLLGPADTTPGGFVNVNPEQFRLNTIPTQVMGTRCRQLALTLLIDSPLTCLTDAPKNYRGQPGLEFFRGLPTVWDETRVLSADFAESLVEVRRKGDAWWLGAMNNDRPLDEVVSLGFLGKGRYELELFADREGEPTGVVISRRTVTQNDTLPLHLVRGGGAVARIRPVGR